MARLRGGGINESDDMTTYGSSRRKRCRKWDMSYLGTLRGGGRSVDGIYGPLVVVVENEQERGTPILSPSLLAADW